MSHVSVRRRALLALASLLATGCSAAGVYVEEQPGTSTDAGPTDAGRADGSAPPDSGQADASAIDSGQPDAGPRDAGLADAGETDSGPPDAGPDDAGSPDAGIPSDGGVPTGPTIGAIKWDAWVGGTGPGFEVERSLGPNKYHDRLPFYAVEGDNTAQIRATTQAIIDREIEYARSAGIGYFAYVLYFDELGTARNLHMTSAHKSDVKFTFIFNQNGWWYHSDEIVGFFNDPDYMRVAGGRPLLYVFQDHDSQVELQALIASSESSGAGRPYIVDMDYSVGNLADAHSAYAFDGGSTSGLPFSSLVDKARTAWADQSVLLVTAGWNGLPRVENPVSWISGGYYASWFEKGTPQEIASELDEAIVRVRGDPSRFLADTILIYAWNEFDEGGWICPNLPDYGGTERLDAIRTVIQSY